MSNIVIDLFHGNSDGFEGCYSSSPAYNHAVGQQEKLEGELIASFSDAQKARFQEYISACQRVNVLCAEQDFFAGYRLGMRLLLAALPQNTGDT